MDSTIKYCNNESDTQFLRILRKKVAGYFTQHKISRHYNTQMIIKIIFILMVFFSSYFLLLSNMFSGFVTLIFGIICGLFSVLIVFNISHDAAHNALFKSQALNKFFTYSFNLVGGNAFSWDLSHNRTHHTYPNIGDVDPDIYQAMPLVRVSSSQPFKKYHQYQYLYAPFLYMLHSIYLIYIKDFEDFGFLTNKYNKLPKIKIPFKEYGIMFTTKLFYLTYSFLIPLLVLDFKWWQIVIGYLCIHFTMGTFMSMVLIPVHMVNDATFVKKDEGNKIHSSWIKNVFDNTVNYSSKSKLANYFFGGLNTHLEHHLFPNVCHVHLINITDIIKSSAIEYGYKHRNLTMAQAIGSHFSLLKKMGQHNNNIHPS